MIKKHQRTIRQCKKFNQGWPIARLKMKIRIKQLMKNIKKNLIVIVRMMIMKVMNWKIIMNRKIRMNRENKILMSVINLIFTRFLHTAMNLNSISTQLQLYKWIKGVIFALKIIIYFWYKMSYQLSAWVIKNMCRNFRKTLLPFFNKQRNKGQENQIRLVGKYSINQDIFKRDSLKLTNTIPIK